MARRAGQRKALVEELSETEFHRLCSTRWFIHVIDQVVQEDCWQTRAERLHHTSKRTKYFNRVLEEALFCIQEAGGGVLLGLFKLSGAQYGVIKRANWRYVAAITSKWVERHLSTKLSVFERTNVLDRHRRVSSLRINAQHAFAPPTLK